MPTRDQLVDLAKTSAQAHGVDPALWCAVIEQESAWNPHAVRYEPGFFKKYVEPQNLTSPTENACRAMSWGLCQIMGQVARELGFDAKTQDFLEIVKPEVNMEFGLRHFKNKLSRTGGDVSKTLLAWNGGSRKEYDDEVLARKERYV